MIKNIRILVLVVALFWAVLVGAQTRAVVNNAIPSDNMLRYYRLALPVTVSAYEEDLNSDYNKVLQFWRECEEFANRMFVPLGVCFDVVESEALVMKEKNMIEESIYNIAFGTELTDAAIGSDNYDVGMWILHRDDSDENSGLTQANGVYKVSSKSNGYAKTDKWVVAHELGHIFGADAHTSQGEGSLMDNEGEFFSYPSILLIRDALVKNGTASACMSKNVENSAPLFDTSVMKDTYRIPKGACMAIPLSVTDEHAVTYSAIGCNSENVRDVNGEWGTLPHFASMLPQSESIIDYSPKYTADFWDDEYYFVTTGTNVPSMQSGEYSIAFLANDMPDVVDYDYLLENPFYSNYSVWDAKVKIVDGTVFNASLSPASNSYGTGDNITVNWGVNTNYFKDDSRLRITMSADYGKTYPYVLAESVPATDGECVVTLPDVNVGNVNVDFKTATRSMRGGIIRIEEINGIAYTLTTISPNNGGGFTVTGGSSIPEPVVTYTVSVTAEPANGGTVAVDSKGSSITVNVNTMVTLSASPKSGYQFEGWYKGGVRVSTNKEYSVTVTENLEYIANFKAVSQPEKPEENMFKDGVVYQILNIDYTKPQIYILDNGGNNAQADIVGDDMLNSLWIVSKKKDYCYLLKNYKTGKYLKGTTAQSGCWTMSDVESPVYIYKENDTRYYISAVEMSDITDWSMSCAHCPSDHTNLVTWYNVDDKSAPIASSLWNFVEYIGDILYIEEVNHENGNPKVIYDLAGRRIENIIVPGIYIVNGKKIMIK